MGSSDTGTGVIDCSVGTIVWVRRRNGSWWPGKILGPDELSASHLMSPRSGTPVKLLGREDASVDWYNLEKSKRVKAFRCGEFDDCIERAEASQGLPPKKREKYARREDAILHALELEKQLLEKKYGKLGCSSNGKSSESSDGGKKESATSPECLEYGNGKHVKPKSHQLSKGLDSSLEDKNKSHHLHAQRVKEVNQLSGNDDNSDVLPRMRGLQEFGLRIAPLKPKLSPSVASNGSQKLALDDNDHVPPNGGLSTESMTNANSKNSLDKRKRSHELLADESPVKRRDRRRNLVRVLESSAKLLDSHSLQPDNGGVSLSVSGEEQTEVGCLGNRSRNEYHTSKSIDCLEDTDIHLDQMKISPSKFEESNCPCPGTLGEGSPSGSTEDTETDDSETNSLSSDTDEAMTTLSDDAASIELRPKSLGRYEAQGEHGSTSSDEPDDLALTSNMSYPCHNDPVSASVGVSKWQLKGRRNTRGLTKRYPDESVRKASKGSSHGINLKGNGSYGYDEGDIIHKNYRTQMIGYGSRGLDVSRDIYNWEYLAWKDQSALKGYWGGGGEYFDHVSVDRNFGGRMKSVLVDVDLKVQSSYQREHVPMISLMSKLNGQAIVGHPIQIEVLVSGSSETILGTADNFCLEALDYDTTLPPVWRTGRRTANCRVPRPHSSTPEIDETAEHLQYVDKDREVPRKTNPASFSHKAIIMRKGLSNASRPQVDRKFLKKQPPKKMSLSSNPKIRSLSSIATQQKPGSDLIHGSNSFQMDVLIKPESVPTAVACIPVKLVFSRLYEELVGRHQ